MKIINGRNKNIRLINHRDTMMCNKVFDDDAVTQKILLTDSNAISFFPNPIKPYSRLVLTNTSKYTQNRIEIFDLSGNSVFNDTFLGDKYPIGRNITLPKGLFFYTVSNKNQSYKQSFVVNE